MRYGRRKTDRDPVARFWKQFVAVCVGVITVSTVAWFVLKTLLVTREEYNVAGIQNAVVQASVQQTLNQFKDVLSEQSAAFKEQSSTLQKVEIEMASIRAASERRRRSE
jgi:hypothetical protein